MNRTVAIIGAGPAGLRAAERLVQASLRPILIDESARPGGQVYRQPPPALRRPLATLYGVQAARAGALFEGWQSLRDHVDYRPDTLAWHLEDRRLFLLTQGRPAELQADAIILATGATDRVYPFPGWTLPGVFTLGGAQVLLKSQASVIGPRVVLAGSGPLLYLVASQLLKAGARVQAVLDAAPPGASFRALPGLLSRPRLAAAGVAMMMKLRFASVPVHRGVRVLAAEGDDAVRSVRWEQDGRTRELPCDAIAFGHGLRSETQLADLAGCAFEFDEVDEAWLPRTDGEGRTSVPWVYLAGDGAGIRGADAAEAAGARAASALLHDWHDSASSAAARDPAPRDGWRVAMKHLSAAPENWAADAPDDLVICRCENVTAGELRACVATTGAVELNRLKALTRIGMGRCQGRMCGAAAARLLAHAAHRDVVDVGRLRSQPPVKPVPVAALGAVLREAVPVPPEESDD